jgi:hypothetical protein
MQTFRVHDAVDDLVDDLVDAARRTIADIDAQLARITATRDAVTTFLAQITATPTSPVEVPAPKPVETRPRQPETRPKTAPAKGQTRCTVCGKSMTTMGLGRHMATHRAETAPGTRRAANTGERTPVAA